MSYNPTRSWGIALTDLIFTNNNGHNLYLKVSIIEGVNTSEVLVDEGHIDPLRDDDFVIYPLGYVHPVKDGFREFSPWLGNAKGGTGATGKSAYQIAVIHGFLGTEVEWLASLEGDDGREIQISTSGGYFVYRYVGDSAWINISPLPSDGDNGKSPEISVQGGYICYRLVGDPTWINIVSIASLKGNPGPGVAAGGNTNQKLVKNSNADYDTKWVDDVSADNSVTVYIDFKALTAFVYTCPEALKFTSQTSQGSAATLSIALNTSMTIYQQLTVTPTALGLVTLTGITL